MTTRAEVHELVESLPESELYAAARYLSFLRATVGLPRFLAEAPLDDEPETEEERAAIAEAKEDEVAGRVVSIEEVKRELGL